MIDFEDEDPSNVSSDESNDSDDSVIKLGDENDDSDSVIKLDSPVRSKEQIDDSKQQISSLDFQLKDKEVLLQTFKQS